MKDYNTITAAAIVGITLLAASPAIAKDSNANSKALHQRHVKYATVKSKEVGKMKY